MSKRKIILRRAIKGALAVAIPGVIAWLASDDFRELVGDDTLTTVIAGLAVPLLLAAEKALKLHRQG